MNSVVIIGRLARDPEVRYTPGSQTAVATFSVAIDRGKDKNGDSRGADFPNVVVFGRAAENCERFLSKGKMVGIQGHIQTGNYKNKNGDTVYTTDVVADRVEFLSPAEKQQGQRQDRNYDPRAEFGRSYHDIPEGFQELEDEDCLF